MAPSPVPSCGGQRAACIYTITGTCRMNGIDPQAYLTMSLQRSLIIPLTRSTLCFDETRASGRATLRRLQWQRANGGSDTMLIWLGKQMLGQKDKVETEATNTHHVSGAFVLGKGDPAEIAQAYRRIIDGTLDDES
jgi:hypothetical protein